MIEKGNDKVQYSSLEDFIFDESFKQFVKGTNNESVDFWSTWIKNNPDKKEEFNKAVQILTVLFNNHKVKVSVDKNESLKELIQNIELTDSKPVWIRRITNSFWIRIAAVLIIAIGILAVWNWKINNNTSHEDLKYCEIIVPIGEKSQVILADCTKVWINSGSSFKYPPNFGEKSRDVYLSGEAFFEVSKQNGKTFVVTTRDVRVNVLGTAFDVKCYPDETKTQTTVVRGLVKIENISGSEQPIYLKPNQMVTIKINNKQKVEKLKPLNNIQIAEIQKVNPDNITCWKDHLLIFYNESFEEMAVKMERWYNLKIVINDETLKKERYTGKFIKNETIFQVLEAIKLTTPIKYKIANNEITITRT
jgi:ferric-dicitrate binding protein FerR (iron transport regulator)